MAVDILARGLAAKSLPATDRMPEHNAINPALSTCGRLITDMLVAMRQSNGGGRLRLMPGATYKPQANTAARTLGGSFLHATNLGAIMVPPGRFVIDGEGALLKMATNGTTLIYANAEYDRSDIVTGPMAAGSNVFNIGAAAAANYAVGDKVLWRLGDIAFDPPETYNWKFARVTATDVGSGTVTLDRHLSTAWDGTGTNNRHLHKIQNCEGSVLGEFAVESLTLPDTHLGGGATLKVQNNIRIGAIRSRGTQALALQYCENVEIGTVAAQDYPSTGLNQGTVLRVAESRGVRIALLTSENMGRHALVAEAASEVTIGTLRNHNTIESATGPGMAVLAANGKSLVHVEKLLMTGLGGNSAFGAQDNSRISFGEVITNTATPIWVLPTPGINCQRLSMTIDGIEERYEADKFLVWERIIWLTDGMTGAPGNGEALIPVNGGIVTECVVSFCGTTGARPVQDDFTNLNIGRTGNSTNMKTSIPAVADGLPMSLLTAFNGGAFGSYAGTNQWAMRAQRPRVAIVTPASGRNLNGSGKYVHIRMKVHPNVLAAQLDIGTAPYLMDQGQWEPEASKAYDFGNIAAGATASTTLTVTGAALGDFVSELSFAAAVAEALEFRGEVTAANTVTVKIKNPTTAAIAGPNTTVAVRVSRKRLGA